jgi:hypothetical protein
MTSLNVSLPNEKGKLICLSPKVIERIASLRKAGTTGILLAGKAEAVISRLKSGETWQPNRRIAPRTAYGEKRIRKCVKYNLGWGFRLITLLRDDTLHICHLGTHDECDRWMADNSRMKEVEAGRNFLYRVGSRPPRADICNADTAFDELDDLDKRLQELPDQTLRRIFSGLVEARRRITQFKRGELKRRLARPES